MKKSFLIAMVGVLFAAACSSSPDSDSALTPGEIIASQTETSKQDSSDLALSEFSKSRQPTSATEESETDESSSTTSENNPAAPSTEITTSTTRRVVATSPTTTRRSATTTSRPATTTTTRPATTTTRRQTTTTTLPPTSHGSMTIVRATTTTRPLTTTLPSVAPLERLLLQKSISSTVRRQTGLESCLTPQSRVIQPTFT